LMFGGTSFQPDSWPHTSEHNSGQLTRLREFLSFDWIAGEDSWLHGQKEKKRLCLLGIPLSVNLP